MEDKLQHITNIGFTSVGQWRLDEDALVIDLYNHADAHNVLYAFVVDEFPCYIGKTTWPLRKRMAGYRTPGPSQSNNINTTYAITNPKGNLAAAAGESGFHRVKRLV